jgi:hypothetical protein
MKFRFKFFGFSIFILVLVGCASAPSSSSNTGNVTLTGKRGSIALFPLTGARQEDGEAIISSLARQRIMRDAFEKVTPLTQGNIAAMNYERDFQKYSLLTDPDSIFEIGKDLKADYVIAGNLTKLGSQNLLIISILGVESLQQIAGIAKPYNSLSEIDSMIPEIANDLVSAVSRVTSGLEGLSVPPFSISSDVNQNDSMVLAQILSCELSNAGNFAILPRTDSLQTVMAEHQRQRTGDYDKERVKRLGNGRNASYVLSGKVESLGGITKFAVDILDIEDGSIVDGYARNYTNSSQALGLVSELAGLLTGKFTEADLKKADMNRQKELDAAAKKAEADAQKAEVGRQRLLVATNSEVEMASLYYQFTTNDEVELHGLGYSAAIRGSPLPFTSIGLEARLGGAVLKSKSKFFLREENMQFYMGIAPTVGLVFPISIKNEPIVKLFGNFVADFSFLTWYDIEYYFFSSPFSPGFETGITFQWGSDKGYGFNIKYRCNFHDSQYTSEKLLIHRVSVGAVYVF